MPMESSWCQQFGIHIYEKIRTLDMTNATVSMEQMKEGGRTWSAQHDKPLVEFLFTVCNVYYV